MSERRTFTWRGVSHSGQARTGQATIRPETMAMMIERYWRAGWPWLEVKCDGAEVGGVKKKDGRRVWWAEAEKEG